MHDIDCLYEQYATDPRPLPLLIAALWNFPLSFVDGDNELYHVQDWIAGVAQLDSSRAAGNFWRALKRRVIELRTPCTQLPVKAANGKTYQMDYADAETLYLITQRMSAETGIRNKVLAYLAKSGVRLDEMRRDPEKAVDAVARGFIKQGHTDRWIDIRLQGIIARTWFTAAVHACLGQPESLHYAMATNDVYLGLWQRTAAQLKKELGLHEKSPLRDHQPELALTYQRLAELAISQRIGDKQMLTWQEAEAIIKEVADMVGEQAKMMGKMFGVDLATGKPVRANTKYD